MQGSITCSRLNYAPAIKFSILRVNVAQVALVDTNFSLLYSCCKKIEVYHGFHLNIIFAHKIRVRQAYFKGGSRVITRPTRWKWTPYNLSIYKTTLTFLSCNAPHLSVGGFKTSTVTACTIERLRSGDCWEATNNSSISCPV